MRELESIAFELSAKRIEALSSLKRWPAALVAPGASLGGARSKANFTDKDGSLWIAKFPAHDDTRDVGGWEWLLHQLASRAGIDVSPARVMKFASLHRTFCVKRFDRANQRRRFFCSVMTLLRKSDGAGGSYLEIAEFIRKNGARNRIAEDLAQLFRRVAFNIIVGNRDDHLRNHGFILTQDGWRLSPAFDMNPTIEKADHAVAIDESDRRPDVDSLLTTCESYGLPTPVALDIVSEVREVVKTWSTLARSAGMARADIDVMAPAFVAGL